jgi:hypothetical protein
MRHAANVRYARYWGMSGLISDIVASTRLTEAGISWAKIPHCGEPLT